MRGGSLHPHRKFSKVEDALLQLLVESHIGENWIFIASRFPGRNVRQLRERWENYLSPKVCNFPWTADEEDLLERKVLEIGKKWGRIREFLPNRSTNQLKYHWITKCRSTAETPSKIPDSEAPEIHLPQEFDAADDCQNAFDSVEDLFKIGNDHEWSFESWAETQSF
jgi:hypothetical protein